MARPHGIALLPSCSFDMRTGAAYQEELLVLTPRAALPTAATKAETFRWLDTGC